ncbi:MAG: hypothetical protein IKA08_00050 [Alphaproteobacteria bacterium]|nr:hypothetical protein [Alphaproteobacteria bacterium]
MKQITHIPKFRRFVIQNFPFIEEDFDALTDYGLISKIVEYLNTVIDSQNDLSDNFTELNNAFNELHDYVEHYFDNLDVQQEINTKLDTMVADGTMDELLNRILLPYENAITARVEAVETLANQNSADITEQAGRIDALAQLTEGSTTGDAELIDGRTNFTGRVYANIGDNIRSFGKAMFKDITSTLTKTSGSYVNVAFNQNAVTGYENYELPTKKGYLYYISCQGQDNGQTVTRPQIMFGYNYFYPTNLINGVRNDAIILVGDGSTIYVNNRDTFTNVFIGELNLYRGDDLEQNYTDITSTMTQTDNTYVTNAGRTASSNNYKMKSFTPTVGKKYIIVTGTQSSDNIQQIYQADSISVKMSGNDSYGCYEVLAKNNNTIYINCTHSYDKVFKIYESKQSTLIQTNSDINRTIGITSNAVFCGDSLTYGQAYTSATSSYQNYYNYPYFMKKLLNLDTIEEYARGGATATSWWNRFNEEIKSTNSIYFVWLGTNSNFTDTVATDCAGDDYTQYAETETGYYGKILGKIKSLSGNKIVMLNTRYAGGGGNVNTNNKVINDLATKFDAIVVDVKNSDAWTNNNYHTINGYVNAVHFNTIGNNYIANVVNNTLQKAITDDPLDFNMKKEHQ